MPSLTLPGEFAVKVLQGKGLPLNEAERKIEKARQRGFVTVPVRATKTVFVTYENTRFTIQ